MARGPLPTVTHIAAPWINIQGRLLQRCAVCGEKLIDSKGVSIPKERGTEGKTLDKIMGTWEAGVLVRTTVGQNPTQYTLVHADEGFYPPDGCIALVE